MNIKTRRVRLVSGIAATTLAMAGLAAITAPAAQANAQGAVTTTINTIDGAAGDLCKNGNPAVNCNIYTDKSYVWLSGIDTLKDGTYFFAVLNPSGQGSNDNPNDGTPNNLSDDFDAYTARTFSVSGGVVTNLGTHDFNSNKIRLAKYADTKNPGGVYILAVCRIDNSTLPVNPSSCKYDAFKVQSTTPPPPPPDAAAPSVSKTAWGDYDNTYTWDIAKSADQTQINQAGGTATVKYTVTLTPDSGTISNVRINGYIRIDNDNDADVTGVKYTDTFSLGNELCTFDPFDGTLAPGATLINFECDLGDSIPTDEIVNDVKIEWPAQDLSDGSKLAEGDDNATTGAIVPEGTDFGACVTVSDVFDSGTADDLGTACVGDADSYVKTYERIITVPNFGCYVFTNTATYVADDTDETDSASANVTACGTMGHTMGYWQNKNGQGLILNAGSSTVTYGTENVTACKVTHYLRTYAPFQDLSKTANCTAAAKYVYDRVKEASAAGAAMNKMLKGQMLATSLTVYFTDPALSGNPLNAYAPLGGLTVDITKWKGGFGGATSMTVNQMLAYAASKSDAGGVTWYSQNKTTQGYAKDAFDAINNQKA